MLDGIDHLVLAVPDPDAAAAALESSLGLRAAGGGRHETLGTFNRLVWLGDSYLELIGIEDVDRAASSWIGRPVTASLGDGGGLATWAVAVPDLDAHLRWVAGSLEVVGPLDGERERADGRVVRWRLAHPVELSPVSPFLIEHDRSGAEWTADERRERGAELHPVGGRVRLASIDVATDSPAAAAGGVRRLLAAAVEPDGRRAVRVPINRQYVRFAAPADRDRPAAIVELVTDVPLRRRTARVGSCELRLRGLPRAAAAPATGTDARTTSVAGADEAGVGGV